MFVHIFFFIYCVQVQSGSTLGYIYENRFQLNSKLNWAIAIRLSFVCGIMRLIAGTINTHRPVVFVYNFSI